MNNALICHVMRGDRYGHSWTCLLCGDRGDLYDTRIEAKRTAKLHQAINHMDASSAPDWGLGADGESIA